MNTIPDRFPDFRNYVHSLPTIEDRIKACELELNRVVLGRTTPLNSIQTSETTSVGTATYFPELEPPQGATLEQRGKLFIKEQTIKQQYIQDVQQLRDSYIQQLHKPPTTAPNQAFTPENLTPENANKVYYFLRSVYIKGLDDLTRFDKSLTPSERLDRANEIENFIAVPKQSVNSNTDPTIVALLNKAELTIKQYRGTTTTQPQERIKVKAIHLATAYKSSKGYSIYENCWKDAERFLKTLFVDLEGDEYKALSDMLRKVYNGDKRPSHAPNHEDIVQTINEELPKYADF